MNFIFLSEQLVKDSSNEAELRTSISRAYYAVFHIAIDKINEIDPSFKYSTSNIHKKILDWFEIKSVSTHYGIKRMSDARKQADYEPNPRFPNPYVDMTELRSKTEEIISMGKSIIQKIKNLQ
ncbi:MAG: hypothetical protein P9L94_08885 [Candidatus Hinthialibacter antarcticus]|nr:hypothetical protein [Candidatus Hinthialibacter antarcticus]